MTTETPKRHRALNGRTAPTVQRARVRIDASDLVSEHRPVLEYTNADGEVEVHEGLVWGPRVNGEIEIAVISAWYVPEANPATGVLLGNPVGHYRRMRQVVGLLAPTIPEHVLDSLSATNLDDILQDLNFLKKNASDAEATTPNPPEETATSTI